MSVSIATDTLRVMLQEAFSRGFAVAAIAAGILGLLAVITLALMALSAPRMRS